MKLKTIFKKFFISLFNINNYFFILKKILCNNKLKKFENKYLYNEKNLEKSTSTKNLIVSNIQGAIGDQIVSLDLISRIFKDVKSKDNFDVIVSPKFKNFIEQNLNLWNLNFIYINYSLGTYTDFSKNKVNFRNILKIAKKVNNLEYDKVLILTRLVPIDCAILLSSIKCNKIYKFFDINNTSKNNTVFGEYPFKKLTWKIFERLKEKIEIKNINSKQHFLFNSINVFNSIWKEEYIHIHKPYEFVNIPKNVLIKNNHCINIFFCLNRISTKILNFEIITKVFEMISNKYNVFYYIVTSKKKSDVKKIENELRKKILNFKIYNKLGIENLVSLMNNSDFILCHDSWDFHMANMLKKRNLLLLLNKNDHFVVKSFDYWLNYKINNNMLFIDSEFFNTSNKNFHSEIVINIFNKIEKILNNIKNIN